MRIILLALAISALSAPAYAQSVTIDPDRYVDALVPTVTAIIGAIVLWVRSRLPKQIAIFLDQRQIDSLLVPAINWGASRVKGAGFTKPVKVDVANPWIQAAVEYLDTRAPQFLDRYGRNAVEEMILARLPIAQDEAIARQSPLAE